MSRTLTPMKAPASGIVTLTAFLDWIQSFMVYGSAQKTWRCGVAAHKAVKELAESHTAGFRFRTGSDRQILTPFGQANITEDRTLEEGDIVVTDEGEMDDQARSKAESKAYGIRQIEGLSQADTDAMKSRVSTLVGVTPKG